MTCWLTGVLCVLDVLGVLACLTCLRAYVLACLRVWSAWRVRST